MACGGGDATDAPAAALPSSSDALLHRAGVAASFVHGRLVAAADRLGLDISPRQIVVQKNGAHYEIDADYVVPLEFFGGFTIDWRFRPHKEGTRRPPAFRD